MNAVIGQALSRSSLAQLQTRTQGRTLAIGLGLFLGLAAPPVLAEPPPRLFCAFVLAPGQADAEADWSLANREATCASRVKAVLEGSGEVIVVANKADWDKASSDAAQANTQLQLYINGISAGDSSSRVGVETVGDNLVKARFHVGANKGTRAMWTALYRQGDMVKPIPLRASVGWSAKTDAIGSPTSGAKATNPKIVVTTVERRAAGLTVIGVLCALMWFCLARTDMFRDGPKVSPGGRATYSLARLQTGLWLLYVIAAGLYIRLVLGDLPTLESSVTGLLGLSAATTFASVSIDSSAGLPVQRSKNFFSDILTADGKQQLHRLQALLVNLLLLAVGVDSVVEDLAYPVFDGTWLALLGISGATQAAMKQAMETPKSLATTPAGEPVTAPVAPRLMSPAVAPVATAPVPLPPLGPLISGRSLRPLRTGQAQPSPGQ
jgi:hypothetical protein